MKLGETTASGFWAMLALLATTLAVACAAPSLQPDTAPDTLTAAIAQMGAAPLKAARGPLKAATIENAGPPVYAIAAKRYLPDGAPLVHFDERPVAGRPWRVLWTTRPTAPYPAAPMRLIVSLTPPGHQQPVVQTFLPGQAGVTQQGGKLYLDVTWPAQWVGLRLWMQAVVTDSRSLSGEIATPILEVVVGEQ